jgi:hypothetical protein
VKVGDIHRFFEDLGHRVRRPVRVLLVGGAAAVLQGVERATFDIDFEIDLGRSVPRSSVSEDASDAIQRAIAETARSTGITPQYDEDVSQWSSITMPAKTSRLYRRFGKVEVRILDPGLWAIGKLTRYVSTDIQDLRIVLKKAKTQPRPIVRLWGTALGISPVSSTQAMFRRQVESFLDQYAGEIWGPNTNSEELKQLFVATAQRARRQRQATSKGKRAR